MIISFSDFQDRPYRIPNKNESKDFTTILAEEEERLAISFLLGQELWDLVNSGSTGETDPYSKIISGDDYTYNSKTYHYKGWVDLVRPALFAHWIPLTTDKLTNVGFVVNYAQEKSSNMEDPYPYVVKHWNEFVLKVGRTPGYGYNYRGSFYGYMNANRTLFPEWLFRCPNFKNRHDL